MMRNMKKIGANVYFLNNDLYGYRAVKLFKKRLLFLFHLIKTIKPTKYDKKPNY